MYEHHKERLLPRRAFLWRIAKHVAVAVLVIVSSLVGGMAGYVHFEGLSTLVQKFAHVLWSCREEGTVELA
jgi:hypothetical protein